MSTHAFTIPGYLPPTLNVLIRSHWSARARKGRECKHLVLAYSGIARTPQATGKRRVSLAFVSRRGERAADHDARLKLLLDALVFAGLLVDDSPQWCELGRIESRAGAARETIVTLEDIEP